MSIRRKVVHRFCGQQRCRSSASVSGPMQFQTSVPGFRLWLSKRRKDICLFSNHAGVVQWLACPPCPRVLSSRALISEGPEETRRCQCLISQGPFLCPLICTFLSFFVFTHTEKMSSSRLRACDGLREDFWFQIDDWTEWWIIKSRRLQIVHEDCWWNTNPYTWRLTGAH